jgi:hypothetical protein
MKAWQYMLVVLVLGLFAYLIWGRDDKQPYKQVDVPKEEKAPTDLDVENQTYAVEGDIFALVDGRATITVPDIPGATNELTIFGEAEYGDLDADGDEDAAVWLMNDPGGTGKFYYAAFVINEGGDAKTVPAFFLGDRIAPQSLSIQSGTAVYSFADRKPDEPFSAEPTVGKSVELRFDKKTNKIIE